MKKIYFQICGLILFCQPCFGQEVTSNKNVGFLSREKLDTSEVKKKAVNVLENYFNSHNIITQCDSCWLESDKDKFNIPNSLLIISANSFFYKDVNYYKPTVLHIINHDTYLVATIAFTHNIDTDFSSVITILDVILVKVKNKLKIGNSTLFNASRFSWKQLDIDKIHFIVDPELEINRVQIDSLINFNLQMANTFDIEPIKFTYVVAKGFEKIQKLRGIVYDTDDYFLNKAGGLAEVFNNLIYAGNGSFYYPHELIHLYTYQMFSTYNYADLFDEGFATFWGGSQNHSLEWHLKKIKLFLSKNDYNLGDIKILRDEIALERDTNMFYAIGGLICKLVYEKKGIEGIKTLFRAGKEDNEVYNVIELLLNVKKENLDNYLKSEINKY